MEFPRCPNAECDKAMLQEKKLENETVFICVFCQRQYKKFAGEIIEIARETIICY